MTASTGTRLGVDLGTTWTAAAVRRGGTASVLTLGTHTAAMPSVVAIDGAEIVAGERAERQVLLDPSSGLRECKRRLGDTAPMVMAGKPYGAEALMGHMLRHVGLAATAVSGGQPDEIVLTHPATWGDYKLDLLREAGRLAGFGNVALVPEPVAAALHYVSLGRISAGDIVAVYDFGGGTFDAAVVQCTEHGAEILGPPEGLERLGGVDLDQLVIAHVDQALDGRLRELDSTDPEVRRALVQLRADCTAAKEALSNDSEATVAITVPGLNTHVRMTRDEFEAAARARITDTLGALDRAIAGAGVESSALAGVLLVGGSSRIPVVSEEVARHTGRPTLLDADLKLVVALGAAGGSTVMATKKTEPVDTADDAPSASEAPASKVPTTASAQAAAKAAALRAAAGAKTPKKDSKEGGFIGSPGMAAGLGIAAVGAAAAGYAGTQLLGDDEDSADAAATDAAADEVPPDGSMDAFDDLGGGGGGGRGGGGGGGRRRRAADDEDEASGGAPPGHDVPGAAPLADISAARAELLERLAQWQPPEGADAAEVAEFRAELEGLVNRFQPQPGQSANDALATLRQQFEDQVEDFVQEVKLDAVIDDRANDDDGPTRDGFDWVPDRIDENGNYVPGHWERARADARPEPVDTHDTDTWVDGYYDANGTYVKGHWEEGPDTPENTGTPGLPFPPETEPERPYTPPIVRDHRGDGDDNGGVSYSDRASGGVEVRDHRGEARDRDYDRGNARDHRGAAANDDPSPFRALEDVFDDLMPAAQAASVTRMAQSNGRDATEEPDSSDVPDAPPTPEPIDPRVTTTADDLLGVDAFADATATAPALNLVGAPAPGAPAAAAAEPVLEPVAAPADPLAFAADPAPVDGLDMVPVTVDATPDFAEPEPATPDPDVPSDLDGDPHTPQ